MVDTDKAKRGNQEKDQERFKWIVTPGLKLVVEDFIELCELLYISPDVEMHKKNHLLICGERGVGKSMFVHIYEKIFQIKSNISYILNYEMKIS